MKNDLVNLTIDGRQVTAAAGTTVLLAAKEGGELVGSVMGVVCRDLIGECNPFMVMENMVVLESRRRHGIGRLLIEELERRAVALGCSYIEFVSSRERGEAHAFYEAVGYQPDPYRGFKKYFFERAVLQPNEQGRCQTQKSPRDE